MASVTGYRGTSSRWAYSSSKGADHALTRCMALDLSEFGIRVNSVSPGSTYTQFVSSGKDKVSDIGILVGPG